jgi:hypothetical protein
MSATSVTAAESLQEVFQALVDTADDQSTPVINGLGGGVDSDGGSNHNWPLSYADNASTQKIASEGGSYPTAGNASYAGASIDYDTEPLATTFELSGTLMDFNKGEGRKFDAQMAELNSAMKKHQGKEEDQVITELEASISDVGTYAGLDRATYGFQSYNAASAAALLALSDMASVYSYLKSDPVVADIKNFQIWSNEDRRTEYNAVAVGTGAGDARIATVQDQVIDAGKERAASQYNSIPWFEATRMTAGTILWFDPVNIILEWVRRRNVKLLAKTKDAETWVITSNLKTINRDPRLSAKIRAFGT